MKKKSCLLIIFLASVSIFIPFFALAEETESLIMQTYFAPPSQDFVTLRVRDLKLRLNGDLPFSLECDSSEEGRISMKTDLTTDTDNPYICNHDDNEWVILDESVWEQIKAEDYLDVHLLIPDDAKVGIGIGEEPTDVLKFGLSLGKKSGSTLVADGGIIAYGDMDNDDSETLETSGPGTRFIWYPKKAALRAGEVTDDSWDDVNIGRYSTAFGYDTSASGDGSFAAGYQTQAQGKASITLGKLTVASEDYSSAFGYRTNANTEGQIALGICNDPSTANLESGQDYLFTVGHGGSSLAGDMSCFTLGDPANENNPRNAIVVTKQGRFGLSYQNDGTADLHPYGGGIQNQFPKGALHVMGDKVYLQDIEPDIVFDSPGAGIADFRIHVEDIDPPTPPTLSFQRINVFNPGSPDAMAQEIITIRKINISQEKYRVGIKNTAPQKTLDVNGTIYSRSIAGDNSGDIRAEGYLQTKPTIGLPDCTHLDNEGKIYYNSGNNKLYGCVNGSEEEFSI